MLFESTGIGSYLLYQESIMQLLFMAGIEIGKAYKVIKAISKKNKDVIDSAKQEFLDGISKLIIEKEKIDPVKVEEMAHKMWTVIINSASYSFNSSHSLSVSIDSLYMAYLKTHYPDETYSTILEYYTLEKKNLDKISECKKEMAILDYTILPIKQGQNNTRFQKVGNTFTQDLLAVKQMNDRVAQILKDINTSPLETYIALKEGEKVTKRHFTQLCKIGYFNDNNKKAELYIPILYDKVLTKKQFRDTSWEELLDELNFNTEEKALANLSLPKYLSKRTAKTYYLDENKKLDLINMLYDLIKQDDYSPREELENEISCLGYIAEPRKYFKDNIFIGTVVARSIKNGSVLVKTGQKENWITLKDKNVDIIKKGQTIILLSIQMVQNNIVASEYVVY